MIFCILNLESVLSKKVLVVVVVVVVQLQQSRLCLRHMRTKSSLHFEGRISFRIESDLENSKRKSDRDSSECHFPTQSILTTDTFPPCWGYVCTENKVDTCNYFPRIVEVEVYGSRKTSSSLFIVQLRPAQMSLAQLGNSSRKHVRPFICCACIEHSV